MTAKFSRGPWKQGDYIVWPGNGVDAQFPIHAPKRGRIALANREVDARLIAAAPELLEALRMWMDASPEGEAERVRASRAAIAKATGGIE